MRKARFLFRVSGPNRTGIVYIWAPCADAQRPTPAELAHAGNLASRQSGDASPEFVRIAD